MHRLADCPELQAARGLRASLVLGGWNLEAEQQKANRGHIPPQLGDLGALLALDLESNRLDGEIPASLGQLGNLRTLNLRRNKLSGPIPPELGGLSKLEILVLHNNKLTGEIPASLGQLSNLQTLNLRSNELSGHIPPELGKLGALQDLSLRRNQLSGEIPASLGQLSNLQTLNLRSNKLSGSIPPELGNLAALQCLRLQDNKLSGPIPKQLGALFKLETLGLGDNALTGVIPAQLGALNKLTWLGLSRNQLSGAIPAQFGALDKLVQLDLSFNQLGGHIPPELGKLGALQALDLAVNQLSGHIPPKLGEIATLLNLDVSGNNLSGGVPKSLERHPNRKGFEFGVPPDGAPVPPWKSWTSLVLPLCLGYLDLVTDISAVISYYEKHKWWFILGLTFVVGPALVAAVFFLRGEHPIRRFLVALHLGLLFEAWMSVDSSSYSHVLVSLRVVEPLYESVPQLMLQMYALLLEWDKATSHWYQWLPLRVFSIVISCASLAYAATGLVAEQPLSGLPPAQDVGWAWCPCITGRVFGTVPASGSVEVYRSRWHPQNFVWAFFFYQVLEIGSRFISLAILASVLRWYFFLVLLWLLGSRFAILRYSLGSGEESLRFRSQLRLVGTPFMDSVMDKVNSYDMGCALTTIEFLVCLAIGNTFSTNYTTQAPDNVRFAWSCVAAVCMVGKLLLGFVMVRPFKGSVGGFGYGQERQEQAPGGPNAVDGGNGDVEQGDVCRVGGVGDAVSMHDGTRSEEGRGARVQEEPSSVMGQQGMVALADGGDDEVMPSAVQGSSVVVCRQGDTGSSTVAHDPVAGSALETKETEDSKVDEPSRCGEVTDESVAGSEVIAMKEAKVEGEAAPSEGWQLEDTARTVSMLATRSQSGDAKQGRR